ncbi:T9SS type A sorting domain-containing protein [Flavobacterium cellulosilyticum]|uniref:T9SS type A sorting domain-containing protein n=1 Tax=Flavobacterium cellulosilyticum TaxID=2541731 RepID=A0A4R5C719_9FLAO|nr:T9SS type A sorting domain-containing protein [Flavobacterium cellulosilyticum]TDD95508.1 T9SS type A sorting domain-containing protein [Flavobacterium cellulosilyticum]
MKKLFFLIMLMISSLGFSQQELIENFESTPPSTYTFAGFEGLGSASIVADPAAGGTRLNGLKLVSVSTGNPWQGAEVILQTSKIRLTTDKTVKVDVYSSQAFTMLGKMEMGGPASAASATYNTPGVWQTLTFTFTQALDGTATANGDYSKIVFFPGWKADNSGFQTPANFTVYVDNITAVKAVIAPDALPGTAAPTPPNRNASDVYSLFSDTYANIPIDTWSAPWDDSDIVDLQIAGNNTKKITFTNFLGVDFSVAGHHLNATAMERFHIDIWTETATLDKSFNFKFSNWNGGAAEANAISFSTTNASSPALPNPNPGTWISIDVPLTAMAGLRNDLAQFIITSNLGIVYVDNIYLYKGTSLGTTKFETSNIEMYPNPVKNTLNISADASINKISVYNVLGQEVITSSPKSNSITIQTSFLSKGVYVVKAEIDGKVSTTKFVKE